MALLVLAAAAAHLQAESDRERIRRNVKNLRSSLPEIRYRAALDLAKMGRAAAPAAAALARAMGDEDYDTRAAAKRALRNVGADAMPGILKAFKEDDPVLHSNLVELILEMKLADRGDPADLVALLGDVAPGTRDRLVEALGQMGEPAVKDLVSALGARDEHVRDAAAAALAKVGLPALVPLREELSARESRERAAAALALGLLGEGERDVVPALAKALHDEKDEVRESAATALGRIAKKPKEAVPALVEAFADESVLVREKACDAASRFGPGAAEILVAAFRNEREEVRLGAAAALGRMGEPSLAALDGALLAEDAGVRAAAARAFVDMDPRVKGVPDGRLGELLSDPDVSVRRAAVAAIAALGYGGSVERELWEAAKDADAEVRAGAVTALAGTGKVEHAKAALEDRDARVRAAAAGARWGQGDEATALAVLKAALPDAPAEVADALGPMRRFAAETIPDLAGLLEHESPRVRRAAATALGRIASASGEGILGRADRWKRADKDVREAVEAGLGWLSRFQDLDEDGRWHSEKFTRHDPSGLVRGPGGPHYSVGVTGLALQAFLAAGYEDRGEGNPYAQNVRAGLGYLLKEIDSDGCIGTRQSQHFMLNHGFGTIALAEAYVMTGDQRYGQGTQHALDFIAWARNPDLAWRYEPRGNENDTDITAVMVTALRMGEIAGLDVDREAYEGAARWIVRMTGPTGKTGYNMPGGSCARPEGLQEKFPPEMSEAMTAAGLWSRCLLGGELWEAREVDRGMRLCEAILPTWSRTAGTTDMYYWYFATLAIHQGDSRIWRKWYPRLVKELLKGQRMEKDGPLAGSWDPIGPWGYDGGRVYSTAIALLSLVTPYRYEEGFMKVRLGQPYRSAIGPLKKARKDDDPLVRAAAELAIDRIERK